MISNQCRHDVRPLCRNFSAPLPAS